MPKMTPTLKPTTPNTATPTVLRHNDLATVANVVKAGGLIVYPTDTIWGLGCDATNAVAVQKLRAVKGKPADAPLIWLLPSVAAVQKYCGNLDPVARKLLRRPRTTVVVNGQGVRVVSHGWLNKLLTRCGVPLVATSANRHGQTPVQSWRQALTTFGDSVTVIKGRKIYHKAPSTVIKVTNGQTAIIRD